MKTLYFNCFSGISGDMTLGALVDIGVPAEYLKEELGKLHIEDEFSLTFDTTRKMGISGTKAAVILHNQEGPHHSHGDHDHHDHECRNLHTISHIIDGSGITSRAKEWALKIFTKVAEAEAKVHGKALDEVHFHEVGATDSIVDIVGAAVCLDYLNVDRIIASPVEVGGGFVKCAHGLFPVPAPATSEILIGIPCTYGKVDSETTTPTGAAILAAMVDEFTADPVFSADKIGYGLGFKDFRIPNVLRVMLAESDSHSKNSYDSDFNKLIECNLDDMNAEDFQSVMDKLFEAGALDVYISSIMMKKSRPAVKLSVLVKEPCKEACLSLLFEHTTTFGVRISDVEKVMLKRELKTVKTSFGPVQIKMEKKGGGPGKWKMEYKDLRALADSRNMSIPALRVKLTEEIGKSL